MRRTPPLSVRLLAPLILAMQPLLPACAAPEERLGVERSAVIGGTEAAHGDQPATGALVRNLDTDSAELICTGTLIGPRAVLTAAHCIVLIGGEIPDFSLAAVAAEAYSGAVYHGLQVHVHPAFAISSPEGLMHDLAILELADEVDGVPPAPLPTAVDAAPHLVRGSLVDLAGYGATDEDGTDEGVKNVGVASIVDLTAEEIVIGGPGMVRNCTGDSGGPSLAHALPPGNWLLGVVSRSLVDDAPCASSAFHARVDAHLPWIQDTMTQIDVMTQIDRSSGGCAVASTSGSGAKAWLLALLWSTASALWRRSHHRQAFYLGSRRWESTSARMPSSRR